MKISAQDIFEAARLGDLDLVKNMVTDDPALVYSRSSGGSTPLHFACTGDNPETVDFLVANGSEVNPTNNQHYTPLHYAAAYNQPLVCAALVRAGARLEMKSREGETPLHLASAAGAVSSATVLLESGADVTAREDRGRTALLVCARESGHVETANWLLEYRSDINARDNSGKGALELAAWRGYKEFVSFLLMNGAAIPESTEEKMSLLKHSLQRNIEPLFGGLLATGMDLSSLWQEYPYLINLAASGGSTSIIDSLVSDGFDVCYQDEDGWGPLHWAAQYDRPQSIKRLIELGAVPEARTLLGQTAYNIAMEESSAKAAWTLLSAGALSNKVVFPVLQGSYLGQKPPGKIPEDFSPGIVGAHFKLHSSVAFSPDGESAAWNVMIPPKESGYSSGRMLITNLSDGQWTYPQPPPFRDGDVPFYHPDGHTLYFLSREPAFQGGPRKENIWHAKRTPSGWSTVQPMAKAVNDIPLHWQFSVDRGSNIYLGTGDGRIMVAQLQDGEYLPPLDFRELYKNDQVYGGSPYISPSGDYLMFSRNGDLYIIFRKEGGWTRVVDLGQQINTEENENCPMVTPDGRYLIFLRSWTPKWVDITELTDSLYHECLTN